MSGLLHLLEKNCYVSLNNSKGLGELQYGPFGTYLRENIFNEWKKSVLNSNEIHVLPVRSSVKSGFSSTIQRMREFSVQYSATLKMRNFLYPFGIASWRTVKNSTNEAHTKLRNKNLLHSLLDPDEFTMLTTTYFCSSKDSVYWFDRLQKLRLRWWKHFSQMPSTFSFIDATYKNPNNYEQVSMQYDYSGEIITIENIFNLGLWKINDNPEFEKHQPHAIVCESSLDRAALIYLLDAYRETKRKVLCFNNSLVPYKATLAFRNIHESDSKEANLLVHYISSELRKKGLTIFQNPHLHGGLTLNDQSSWFDELGIPYVIILDSSSLSNGIVYVRNRDSTLEEHMHVSDVTEILQKYCRS